MNMKKQLWICLLVLLSYVQHSAAQNTGSVTVIPLDTTAHHAWHLEGNKPVTLTLAQANAADSILSICIAENLRSADRVMAGTFIGNHTFRKQFIPSVNAKGEVVIWANCFSERMAELAENWEKDVFIVNDGGGNGDFFNVVINLSTGTYSNLYINGM
jgi:hypothetical protein